MTTLFQKGLVFAVVVLFIGAGVVPSIIGDNGTNSTVKTEYATANIIPGKLDGTASKNDTYNGSLSGYVTDTSMNPIEGARIRVSFHDTYEENYTDASGYYNVTNISICYCMKNATASKNGYTTEWILLSIVENTTHDFILAPLFDVYVDDDADPGWYDATHVKTIQEGIDNATAGDTVFVYNGTYYERLIINKSILLTGEDEDTTIMHGYDTTGEEETVAIVLYPLENVSISGFTISNSSSGILAYSMYGSHADNCSIYDNIFETGEGIGIDILLDGSTNMRIHDNIMNHGIDIYESFDNIIENNLIHGKSLVYLENKSDQIIENAGQVILNRCSNITVINCEITNTFSGIQLHKSDDTYVYNNILTGNYYGIEIRSEYNIIEENTIESNDYGILLQSQESNKIFHNNFITNIYQVGGFFSSYNMWYDIATESGNYWDDYDGIDSDGDGIKTNIVNNIVTKITNILFCLIDEPPVIYRISNIKWCFLLINILLIYVKKSLVSIYYWCHIHYHHHTYYTNYNPI